VKLLRVTVSTHRTEFVATNDCSQALTDAVQDVCGLCWKTIGVSPRVETVNPSGSLCLCRKARIPRHHIACALLVWSRLKSLAYQTRRTVYQIKHEMLSDYLIEQLKHPSVQMTLA
jgi:hypothetical protein